MARIARYLLPGCLVAATVTGVCVAVAGIPNGIVLAVCGSFATAVWVCERGNR